MSSPRLRNQSASYGLDSRARTSPPLDHAKERELIAAAQHGDTRAEEALVLAHLRLAVHVARKHQRRGVALEDLVSEGVMGLLEAIRRFDLARDNTFSTYATYWIRARIRRFADLDRQIVAPPSTRVARVVLRGFGRASHAFESTHGRTPSRDDIAVALGVSADDVAMVEPVLRGRDARFGAPDEGGLPEPATADPSPEQLTSDREIEAQRRLALEEAIAKLPPRERLVVTRRLGDEDAVPFARLGDELGVSRERVRQLEAQARTKLRAELRRTHGFG